MACIVDRLGFEWLWPGERDGPRVIQQAWRQRHHLQVFDQVKARGSTD
jgi:hypothetical protein